MKESSWNDCITNMLARKVSPDIERAKSLIETAKDRVKQVNEINDENVNFVFEDYYTSLLELLQALAFRKGFNVLNHVCIGYYLRDVLKRDDLRTIFDDLRYKRNSLMYYGKRMDYETAKHAIDKCEMFIKEIEKY